MSFQMPQNLDELPAALREKDKNTYNLCAGGTDLVIHLRKDKNFHYSLIDLTHLPELSKITETEDHVLIRRGRHHDRSWNKALLSENGCSSCKLPPW